MSIITFLEFFVEVLKPLSNIPSRSLETIEGTQNWFELFCAVGELNNATIIFQLIEQKDIHWGHGLLGACRVGHLQLAQYAISKGAKIDACALSLACELHTTDIPNYLFSCLSGHHFVNPADWIPLLCELLRKGKMEMAVLLTDHVFDPFPHVICAAFQEKSTHFLDLVMQKRNPDLKQGHLETVLRYACSENNIEMAHWAMKHGAKDVTSGLWGACYEGHIEIIQCMINYGASGNEKAMMWALFGGKLNAIEFLKQYGVNDFGFLQSHHKRVVDILNSFDRIICRDACTLLGRFIDLERSQSLRYIPGRFFNLELRNRYTQRSD